MCTLAIFGRTLPRLPLVVAANRDEFYRRPATAPTLLVREPLIMGGRDLMAGGSWLTVNQRGVVVGVLNRRTEAPPDPQRTSRGTLCLELAQAHAARDAAERLADLSPERHNPFNILIADARHAFVAQNRSSQTFVQELEPGTHVLTNLDLNDPTCPRISRSARRFEAVAQRYLEHLDQSRLLDDLRSVLADHATALDDRTPSGTGASPINQLCIHTEQFGTRSSSVILGGDSGGISYFHSQGPPCLAAYRRVALPWPE